MSRTEKRKARKLQADELDKAARRVAHIKADADLLAPHLDTLTVHNASKGYNGITLREFLHRVPYDSPGYRRAVRMVADYDAFLADGVSIVRDGEQWAPGRRLDAVGIEEARGDKT